MGWVSKVLRGLGQQCSDGTHQKGCIKDKPRTKSLMQDGSGFDENEVTLAVALSLSEQHQLAAQETDTQRGTGMNSVDDEKDIELAVALSLSEQDQLVERRTETLRETGTWKHVNQPSPKEPAPKLWSLNRKSPRSAENQTEECENLDMNCPPCTCAGCNCRIEHGRHVSRSSFFWHPECFRCHSCEKSITDDFEFSKSKRRFYHKSCYKVRCTPKCFVCKEPLPLNSAGRQQFCMHPFWRQVYCPSHEADGTPSCCACERMKQKDVEYLKLDDGRKLCLECFESGTMDTIESQSVYFEVREFFEGLHMKIEQDFPLYLVESPAINHAREEEKLDDRGVVQTRGLCLSEVQTVATVLKGPRNPGDKVVIETVQLVRRCEVTAILILYGLPRLLTGSILAHELMHAWLWLNGYKNLKPYVEEGICQVMAHRWLESETFASDDAAASSSSSSSPADTPKKGKQPDFEKKLVKLFKRQIETDPTPDYGDGFRKAIKAVTKSGLKQTLKYIKENNDFP